MNSHVSLNSKDVMQCHISRGEYETHARHVTHVTNVELFQKFHESNLDVKITLNTFVKLKPLYVKLIIVCDTICCRSM
jgi:hypothetical protein